MTCITDKHFNRWDSPFLFLNMTSLLVLSSVIACVWVVKYNAYNYTTYYYFHINSLTSLPSIVALAHSLQPRGTLWVSQMPQVSPLFLLHNKVKVKGKEDKTALRRNWGNTFWKELSFFLALVVLHWTELF